MYSICHYCLLDFMCEFVAPKAHFLSSGDSIKRLQPVTRNNQPPEDQIAFDGTAPAPAPLFPSPVSPGPIPGPNSIPAPYLPPPKGRSNNRPPGVRSPGTNQSEPLPPPSWRDKPSLDNEPPPACAKCAACLDNGLTFPVVSPSGPPCAFCSFSSPWAFPGDQIVSGLMRRHNLRDITASLRG